MSQLQLLAESAEYQTFMEANNDILTEAEAHVINFKKVLKSFVMENADQFIAENLTETFKNIKVFSEVAMSQFMTEVSAICGSVTAKQEEIVENSINEYL